VAAAVAACYAAAGCVQALLTAGASIDLPMMNPSRQHSELPVVNGSTALHLAADYGHTAIAALLLHAHVSSCWQPRTACGSGGGGVCVFGSVCVGGGGGKHTALLPGVCC
jgi:hypothetical protein